MIRKWLRPGQAILASGFIEKFYNIRTGLKTCGCQSFRITFVAEAIMKWTPQLLDISSVFLLWNGDERDVLLKPSSIIYKESIVFKLKRCI